MWVTIFRSRLRPDHRDEYELEAARVESLARKQPGFIAIKTFVASDGERVSLVEFETEAQLQEWKRQPDHVAAQERGRERYYDEYSIQVAEPSRAYSWSRACE